MMIGTDPSYERKVSKLSVRIPDRFALYVSYLPFLTKGGLFIPTAKPYRLGDLIEAEIFLPEVLESFKVKARVVWLTPKGAAGTLGIGFEFEDDGQSHLKNKIENILSTLLNTDQPTHTM